MKKFMCRCGMWMVILALAAGIFYLMWSARSKPMGENGTLVKNMGQNMCREAKNCLNL